MFVLWFFSRQAQWRFGFLIYSSHSPSSSSGNRQLQASSSWAVCTGLINGCLNKYMSFFLPRLRTEKRSTRNNSRNSTAADVSARKKTMVCGVWPGEKSANAGPHTASLSFVPFTSTDFPSKEQFVQGWQLPCFWSLNVPKRQSLQPSLANSWPCLQSGSHMAHPVPKQWNPEMHSHSALLMGEHIFLVLKTPSHRLHMTQDFCPLVLEKLFGGQGMQIWPSLFPQKVPAGHLLQESCIDLVLSKFMTNNTAATMLK